MPNQGMLGLLEGFLGFVAGVLVTLLVRYRQSKKRVLTYEKELMRVFEARRGFDDRIRVKYGDVLVDSLYSCRVVVRNRGNVHLSDQPILIKLKENVTVLEERFETNPALEFGEIRVDEKASNEWTRRYRVALINPGDEISVDLTVAGDLALSDVAVAARGGGLKCLPEDSYVSKQRLYKALCFVTGALLVIAFLITLIGLALRESLPPVCPQVIDIMATLWDGIVPAVLGYGFSYFLTHWQSPKKRLSYEVVPPRPVFATHPSYRAKVSVEYIEIPVEDLYTCRVVLRNAGNRPLENQSMLVWFRGANILDASVRTEPELEFGDIECDDTLGRDRRRCIFSQLEPKDKVTIDFAVEGKIAIDDVQVAARGKGLKIVSEGQESNLVSLLRNAVAFLWLLVLLGLSVLFVRTPFVPFFLTRVAKAFDVSPIWAALLVGVVVFSAVAGIIGRVVFRLGMWSKQAAAADQPQTATTSKTPRQVIRESSAARVKLLGCQLIMLIVVIVAVLGWLGLLDDVLLYIQQIIRPTG